MSPSWEAIKEETKNSAGTPDLWTLIRLSPELGLGSHFYNDEISPFF
jgi:hypothetical protein